MCGNMTPYALAALYLDVCRCCSCTCSADPAADARVVMLHIHQGSKKLPTFTMPIEQGKVDLMQLRSTIDPLTFEKIAVSDTEVSKPSYEPLECLTVPAQPGQHLYITARHIGMLSEDTACTGPAGHALVETICSK